MIVLVCLILLISSLGSIPKDMDQSKCLPFEDMLPLDRYMLHLITNYQVSITNNILLSKKIYFN